MFRAFTNTWIRKAYSHYASFRFQEEKKKTEQLKTKVRNFGQKVIRPARSRRRCFARSPTLEWLRLYSHMFSDIRPWNSRGGSIYHNITSIHWPMTNKTLASVIPPCEVLTRISLHEGWTTLVTHSIILQYTTLLVLKRTIFVPSLL